MIKVWSFLPTAEAYSRNPQLANSFYRAKNRKLPGDLGDRVPTLSACFIQRMYYRLWEFYFEHLISHFFSIHSKGVICKGSVKTSCLHCLTHLNTLDWFNMSNAWFSSRLLHVLEINNFLLKWSRTKGQKQLTWVSCDRSRAANTHLSRGTTSSPLDHMLQSSWAVCHFSNAGHLLPLSFHSHSLSSCRKCFPSSHFTYNLVSASRGPFTKPIACSSPYTLSFML